MNIRNISTVKFVLIMIVLSIYTIGCERISHVTDSATSNMDETEGTIEIGLVLPLTGRHAITFGESIQQALELARNEINNSDRIMEKLIFLVEDNQSTVEGSVAAYRKLIEDDRVSIILGPATSSATQETYPIAGENQVVAISPTSAARGLSAISDYTFRIALTTDVLIPNGVEETHKKLDYKKVATLYDETDVFSSDGDKALQETLTSRGVEILGTETFRGGETDDFTDQLTRIQALNPDAIFVSSLPPEKPGILLKAHELDISVPLILRTLTEDDIAAAGAAAEGAITFVGWGSAVDTPGNQTFIENYKNTYGADPNNYAARSYATLNILAEAIRNAESNDATAIRDALADITAFDTILGKFSFNENGDAVYEPKILIVRNGKLVLFE